MENRKKCLLFQSIYHIKSNKKIISVYQKYTLSIFPLLSKVMEKISTYLDLKSKFPDFVIEKLSTPEN